jgi:hypothetical protein
LALPFPFALDRRQEAFDLAFALVSEASSTEGNLAPARALAIALGQSLKTAEGNAWHVAELLIKSR